MSYFDDFTKHIIDTEFYAQYKEDALKESLKTLTRRLEGILLSYDYITSKKKANEVLNEIKEEVAAFTKLQKEKTIDEADDQNENESSYLKELMYSVFGVLLGLGLASYKIRQLTFNGEETVESFFSELQRDLNQTASAIVNDSFIYGNPTSDSKEFFESKTTKIINNAGADIHTFTTSVQRNTQFFMFDKESKFKYQYVSMLDRKTCLTCASNAGKIYDSMKVAVHLPLHERCRCFYIPTLEYIEVPLYAEWFSQQDANTQFDILGRTRYNLYRNGISIDHFTSEGRKLTLPEVYEDINKSLLKK